MYNDDMNEKKEELEINKQHREDYEKLMQESSTKLDGYWDKNNPFVKIVLFLLGTLIVAGVGYYIYLFLNSR